MLINNIMAKMIAFPRWERNQIKVLTREPNMGPLIHHQDNSFFYCPGNEPVKSGFNNDPMKRYQTWYLNNETEKRLV